MTQQLIFKSSCWKCKKAWEDPQEQYSCPQIQQHWQDYEEYSDRIN